MIVVVEQYGSGSRGGYRYHRCDTKAEADDYEHALNQSDTTVRTWRMEPLDALAFAIEARLSAEWPCLHIEGWGEEAARAIIREELDRASAQIR